LVRTARQAGNRMIRRAAREEAATAGRLLQAAALLRDIEQTAISCADAMREDAKPSARSPAPTAPATSLSSEAATPRAVAA
jgi:hypothetical protein